MGTWGTAIFADDLASDVRGDWRDAILAGEDAVAVSARLEAEFAASIVEPDDAVVFWLALAATQMETGRLLDSVRDRALQIIDAGGDVLRWEEEGDPGLARQREKVLQRLAVKLRGPQQKPKRLRPPRMLGVPFEIGDVILVRNEAVGTGALFVVVDQQDGPGGDRQPVMEALVWEGGEIPSEPELARLPAVLTDGGIGFLPDGSLTDFAGPMRPHMIVAGTHRKDQIFGPHIGEVVARGIRRKPSADFHRGSLETKSPCLTTWTTWPGVVLEIGTDGRFWHEMKLTQTSRRPRRLLRRK